MAAKAAAAELLDIDGHEVRVTNPHKVYFPAAGVTKLDLVGYYLAVADAALRAIGRRPLVLKRYVNGIEGEGFYQKRAPVKRPDWVRTVELTFPSGRHRARTGNQQARATGVDHQPGQHRSAPPSGARG